MSEINNLTDNKLGKIILALSLPLLVFLVIASYSGIFITTTYARNTASFAAQGIGQDIVNLFIVAPLLLASSILFYKGNKRAMLIWAGLDLYVIYSYVIYCFAQPFNFLFLVYCAVLGFSFYAFVYLMTNSINTPIKQWYKSEKRIKLVIIFNVIIAGLFYFVWLSEVIPALISNEIPQSIIENGVITNPVHVLDMAIFLPALVITAVFLYKGNDYGFLFAPILLIFLSSMALAIIGMVITMWFTGVAVDLGMASIFIVIAAISILLAVFLLKDIER